MSIYNEILERVESGENFYIDFKTKTIKVGRNKVIDNGNYDTSKSLYDIEINNPQVLLDTIERLYKNYKYSLPTERSESKRRKYFKALSMEKIADEQLFISQSRDFAQAAIEAFILCAILNKDFVWDESIYGKWFYQSSSDPDLVILKAWINN